ncbi:hypothetical protein D3C73_1572090 [compost metagenome]
MRTQFRVIDISDAWLREASASRHFFRERDAVSSFLVGFFAPLFRLAAGFRGMGAAESPVSDGAACEAGITALVSSAKEG